MRLSLNRRNPAFLLLATLLIGAGFALVSNRAEGAPNPEAKSVHVALLVRLEAKPGKEAAVQKFLEDGLPIVQGEPATRHWFALRFGPSSFGIFDTFPDDAGRKAHLNGQVAAALMAKAPELFSKPPTIESVDLLATKP